MCRFLSEYFTQLFISLFPRINCVNWTFWKPEETSSWDPAEGAAQPVTTDWLVRPPIGGHPIESNFPSPSLVDTFLTVTVKYRDFNWWTFIFFINWENTAKSSIYHEVLCYLYCFLTIWFKSKLHFINVDVIIYLSGFGWSLI